MQKTFKLNVEVDENKTLIDMCDKSKNYLLDIEKGFNNAIKDCDKKDKKYFDNIRIFRDNWTKLYNETTNKANTILYGNPEGKENRKYRDRYDLYIKVVQRSQKYIWILL